ncbi:MAG: PaaI family thioesterase [Deltaproteobacteria bacterium]|nr:PaaI family thioesterase [Deltaproteobacteria bacterium]
MQGEQAVQDLLHQGNPIRHCFGCGADNHGGLRLKSFVQGDELVARWQPAEHHCSYPGYLNGGVAAALIDCHSAWTAFMADCREHNLDPAQPPEELPAGWTRVLNIEFLKAVPMNTELVVRSKAVKKGARSRTVSCSIYANGEECVRGEAVIVNARK